MFDISWGELMLIGVVALIVIGPKELPGVLRTVGQWVGRMRRMASEFQVQFQEAMREAEMADLKKHVDELNETTRDLSAPFDPLAHATQSSASSSVEGTRTAPADTLSSSESSPSTTTPTADASPASTPGQAGNPTSPDVSVPMPEPVPPLTEKDFASSSSPPTPETGERRA